MRSLFATTVIPFLGILLPYSILATISTTFSQFLTTKFGAHIEALIARRDLGTMGSFGGGKRPNIAEGKLNPRRPIVMVHGLSTIAGEYENLRQYFLLNNYAEEELYASSYGNGPVNWTHDSMTCGHVQRLRWLIIAVANYTGGSQVDVIGYSMGSPIARKAILGGVCVDTGEELGVPLTVLVHTFLGVAGANRDCVNLCGLLNPMSGDAPCNSVNGMACHSRFLDDINYAERPHYEASQRIYTIYSRHDETVGFLDCDGMLVSSIPYQNGTLELIGYSHLGAILGTPKEQFDMISGKYDRKVSISINWTMPSLDGLSIPEAE